MTVRAGTALAVALAALALASPASAAKLAIPPATGFVVGYHAQRGTMTIDEFVPRGETVQRWSRMITIQRLAGMGRTPERQFVYEVVRRYVAACPRAVVTAVPFGKTAAGARIDCPRTAMTGAAETVFIRALAGGGDMFSVQIAFRGFAMPPASKWARDYIGGVRLVA